MIPLLYRLLIDISLFVPTDANYDIVRALIRRRNTIRLIDEYRGQISTLARELMVNPQCSPDGKLLMGSE